MGGHDYYGNEYHRVHGSDGDGCDSGFRNIASADIAAEVRHRYEILAQLLDSSKDSEKSEE